jgi:hypothetical protein
VRVSQKPELDFLGSLLETALANVLVSRIILFNVYVHIPIIDWENFILLGMNFSLAEQRVVLSMLLRKFTWTLPEGSINKDRIILSGGMGILSPLDLHLKFSKRF